CFAGTNTIFTGFLRGDDLAHAYAAADIFAFPSANETLGNVVLEAMASGLPVVAPRSGGVLDNVIDKKTGLLFAPESQDDFTTAINKLVTHEWYARRLGHVGRKHAEQKNWETILDGLLDDYALLISRQTEFLAFSSGRRVA
ncbi:MAG: glycosyltransferase, partial [Anaerolineae bacterium]|nr:glycosyltransferase [Anaerolineae bacterium]